MSQLADFALVLMNHVRNDAKTSQDAIQSSLMAWKQSRDQKQQAIYEKEDAYREAHEKPRLLREEEYHNYLQLKNMAYLEAKDAPTSMRKQKIIQWLKIQLPESLKDGLSTDLIYTSGR